MWPRQKAEELGLYNHGGINWEWFYGNREKILEFQKWLKEKNYDCRGASESDKKSLGDWSISVHR